MMEYPLMVVIALLSAGMSLVFCAALVTYVVRTWQLIRADREGLPHEEVLDRLDRLQIQVEALSRRLPPPRTDEDGDAGRDPG